MDLLILSLAPVVIILFYIWFRDKYEKEPFGMLVKALLAGGISVIPVMAAGYFAEMLKPAANSLTEAFYTSFITAGFIEEGFKFVFLYGLIWKSREFNEKFDGIVYAVFISLGFAAVENILYVSKGGHEVALVRAFTAVPAHALFGIRMGYYIGIAHAYREWRRSFLLKALFIPVLLHGAYDFLILSGNYLLLLAFIPYLVWLFFSGFRQMKVISAASEFIETEGESNSGVEGN